MIRSYNGNSVELPSYYLSISSRDLDERRLRWEEERTYGKLPPVVEPHSFRMQNDPKSGLVVTVNTEGEIVEEIQADGVQGIMVLSDDLLLARHGQIDKRRVNSELTTLATSPVFNDIHSLRPTENGILLASTGTDSVYEISQDGKDILWDWQARDAGYDKDSFGTVRPLPVDVDHREYLYDTWLHTTHVNSAMEVGEASILATLFHQGKIISIDKETGNTSDVLANLKRPHALRKSEKSITLANTAAGIAIKATFVRAVLKDVEEVKVPTKWLQDFHIIEGYYYMVDGENSRVIIMDNNANIVAIDQHGYKDFIYEVEPIAL